MLKITSQNVVTLVTQVTADKTIILNCPVFHLSLKWHFGKISTFSNSFFGQDFHYNDAKQLQYTSEI